MTEYKSYLNAQLFSVKGKNCIVSGAATGIGKGMVLALAVNGAKVLCVGRRLEKLEEACAEINAACKDAGSEGSAIPLAGDVSTKAGVSDVYDKAVQHIDRLDYMVNNAGVAIPWRVPGEWNNPDNLEPMLWSVEDSDFSTMTAIHVSSPYFMAIKFLPLLRKSSDPCITNITSIASVFLNRKVCEFSYAQSKAAELHLTRLMAAGLLAFKVRVNCVQPGLFPSQLTVGPDGEYFKPMAESIAIIPKGRPGLVEEMAGPVLMLGSPAGGYLNGIAITVDGGWTMTASASEV